MEFFTEAIRISRVDFAGHSGEGGCCKKYVVLCCLCGGLSAAVGSLFLAVHAVLSAHTASLALFETVPSYIPGIMVRDKNWSIMLRQNARIMFILTSNISKINISNIISSVKLIFIQSYRAVMSTCMWISFFKFILSWFIYSDDNIWTWRYAVLMERIINLLFFSWSSWVFSQCCWLGESTDTDFW